MPGPSIEARCSIRLSAPPSEVARFHNSVRAAVETAARSPSLTRIDNMPPKPPCIWRLATAWPGLDGRPGYSTSATSGCLANCSASAMAPSQAALTRRCTVRMPRISRNASSGPITWPRLRRLNRMRAQKSSMLRVASAPASTSEWPFRYFVAECMTMSAPCSSGRVSTGVAQVESTASLAPASCAASAAAAISVTPHIGLDGVSIQTSLVLPGRMAARSALASSASANVVSMPQRLASLASQLRSDQYMTVGATT